MKIAFRKLPAMVLLLSGASLLSSCAQAQDSANLDRGREVFDGTCVLCHGADGKGDLPGTPDFTKSGGVLSQDEDVLIDHITNGFESPGSVMPMPARGSNPDLTDQDIADVLAYLHEAFEPDE